MMNYKIDSKKPGLVLFFTLVWGPIIRVVQMGSRVDNIQPHGIQPSSLMLQDAVRSPRVLLISTLVQDSCSLCFLSKSAAI